MAHRLGWGSFIVLFCFGISVARADLGSAIDGLLQAYDKPGHPGASVLVWRSGAVEYRRAYGLADVQADTPAVEATNYRMASVSKQFTAMAILLLVQDGRLTLEESLTDIFSSFPVYGRRITVRHLLGHTSGLKDYEPLIPSSQTNQVDDADVLKMMERQAAPDFEPGSRYRYSNSGYCVLAQIVERRSGMPFERFVTERIFTPLGMDDSRVYRRDEPPLIPNRAYGHSRSGNGFVRTDQSVTSATQGDGGIYTSAVDYARWLDGLDSLVAPHLVAAMFTPGKLNNGTPTTYGLGWVVDTYRGLKRYSHTGSTIGFRTAVQWFPEKDIAVALFVNRAESTPWDTARQIADKLLFPNG